MIPVPDTLTEIDELPGEEIEFTIGDPRFVMKSQSKMYGDISTAIIREYSTNAYDAHVMAGHTDPIEVTLPSHIEPFFIVTDHGVGMNRDTFKEIYTQFGVSNKRQNIDLNGQLGYGSKSGVAYTQQFQVTSVLDGIRTEAIVQRKPDWRIVLKVVSQVKTDDPNGSTIKIPVHNVDEFNHKAKEFYKFWLPGRVLVNGKEPDHHVGQEITDNLYYSKDWNSSYVVMGNAPYRIENPYALFRNSDMNAINFVAYVDDFKTEDGTAPIEFVPNREGLEYTERTISTLQSVIDDFQREIVEKAQAEVNNADSHAEAYKAWKRWTNALGTKMFDALEFKGDKFVSDFKIKARRYSVNSGRNSVYGIDQWNVESMHNTMVVTDFTVDTSSAVKKKARDVGRDKGWTFSYILFTPSSAKDIESVWFDKDQFVTWDEVKARHKVLHPPVKKDRTYSSGRIKGSFDLITRHGWEYEKTIPDTVTDVYFLLIEDQKWCATQSILQALDSDANVLVFGRNRLAKFTRENPSVQEFVTWAKTKVVTDTASLLCDEAKEVKQIEYTDRDWLRKLDAERCDDPDIARWQTLIQKESVLFQAYNHNINLANWLRMGYTVKTYNPSTNCLVSRRYPLLSEISRYGTVKDHVYLYLNAAYAAENGVTNV